MALEDLRGPQGAASTVKGDDGKSVQLRTTATEIQWAPVGSSTWTTIATLESLRGPKGNAGADSTVAGPTGASAYQVWIANGNSGTEAQYLASLKGVKGDSVKGDTGSQGLPGGVLLLGPGVTTPPTNPAPAVGTIIAYRVAQ